MNKTKLLYLLYCLLAINGQAQSIITGSVKKTDGHPIPYASIRLLKQDSTFVQGTVSDSIGNYKLSNVKYGSYLLSIGSMGYTTHTRQLTVNQANNSLDAVRLTEDNIMLQEIEVKGSSFMRQKDRVLIIPDKQQAKHATTGYDLLYNLMIPGVNIDRRSGSVRTLGGEVTLYINGRKADYHEIRSLRPKDIEKVEYFDAPSGKYVGDIASINYIVKQENTGGYVTLDGEQTIGYLKGNYNAAAKLSHGNTSYTLFAGHTMQEYEENDNNGNESYTFPEYTLTKNSITDLNKVKNNQQYAQLNIVNQNSKRTLQGKISFVRKGTPENSQDNRLAYSELYDDVTSHTFAKENSLMPSVDLYGNFQLTPNQWLECSLPFVYTHNSYNRTYAENDFSSFSDVKEDMYEFKPSIKYMLQMKHQNTLTMHFTHLHRITSSDYSGDYASWQHLWTGETLFFVTYNQHFGKKYFFSGRVGLSSLQYKLHGYGKTSHVSPRGEIMFGYHINDKQQAFVGGAVGNAFPEISTINDAEQTVDMLHIRRGNPNLDKVKMYTTYANYSAQFGRFNLFGMFMYSSEFDTALPYFYTENNKLIETFQDGSNYHQLRGSIDLTWKATDALHIMLSGRWGHYKMTGNIRESQNSVFGRLNVNYFWKDFSINLYGNTQTKELTLNNVYQWEDGNYGIILGWHHENWAAEAGANNLFWDKHRSWSFLKSNIYSYNRFIYNRTNQQSGYVKLSYTFDFGKKTTRDWKNVDTNINSAILKTE